MIKLSQRDKRALKLGAVGTVAILAFWLGSKWLEHWGKVKQAVAEKEQQLDVVSLPEGQRQRLLSTVPVFEMPQAEEKQKFLFRNKLAEQLKKTGVKCEAMQFLPAVKSRHQGYRLLRLKCQQAKAKFPQILDLLAALKENPYLVGIEKFEMKCDPKKKKDEFQVDLTVSTFVK